MSGSHRADCPAMWASGAECTCDGHTDPLSVSEVEAGSSAHAQLGNDWADGKPTRVDVSSSGRNPVDIADEVVEYLLKNNEPPELYAIGSTAAILDDAGSLQPFDADKWLYYVGQRVNFYSTNKDGARRIGPPPHHAMKMIPPAILPKLPPLDGVVHTPYLDPDGSVVDIDGYHPESRLVLRSADVKLPPVSRTPTRAQVDEAVQLLTEEWLGDFPFASAASKANMVALLLTLTGRAFFELAPLTVIDASTPGSGKGLLAHTLSLIFEGTPPHLMELPADGEEQRKKITTALLAGNDLIVWDESPVITGRTLALILTAATYSDRMLGGNKMIVVKNRFTQVALGNNVQVWGDLKRRVMPIRLEPDNADPHHRSGFRHPNLERWVSEHRGALLGAVLTIWRAWVAAGKPRASVTFGSFERWAGVVGGALQAAGIRGFLADTGNWLEQGDPDADGWGEHLQRLREIFGDNPFTAKNVADRVLDGFIELPYLKRDPDRSLTHIIGNAYRSVRARWYGDLRLDASATKNSATGGKTWRVIRKTESQESQKCQESQHEAPLSTGTSDTTDTTETASLASQPFKPSEPSTPPSTQTELTELTVTHVEPSQSAADGEICTECGQSSQFSLIKGRCRGCHFDHGVAS